MEIIYKYEIIKDVDDGMRQFHCKLTLPIDALVDFLTILKVTLRAGVCRPCVETELTATKKSATDGN